MISLMLQDLAFGFMIVGAILVFIGIVLIVLDNM